MYAQETIMKIGIRCILIFFSGSFACQSPAVSDSSRLRQILEKNNWAIHHDKPVYLNMINPYECMLCKPVVRDNMKKLALDNPQKLADSYFILPQIRKLEKEKVQSYFLHGVDSARVVYNQELYDTINQLTGNKGESMLITVNSNGDITGKIVYEKMADTDIY